MYSWIALAVFCGAFCVLCNAEAPCKLTDEKCLNHVTNEIFTKITYTKVIDGDPDLGIENLDPIRHAHIEGNLSVLKYSINDSVSAGFKDCQCKPELKMNSGVLSLHIDLLCPKFVMNGKYEIGGRLILLPVEGKGDFFMSTNKYQILIDAELKVAPGKDGKIYISVKNFKQTSDPLGRITFDFQNLFNGRKDLADAVLKFANENWYEVAKEVQDPIFTIHAKKIVNNYNKYLKKLPVNDLITL